MELTRESILAMEPGREMDALVAKKVMGINVPNIHNANFYSTDIEAAWEVVENLRRPFSSRMKFSKEMQKLMNKELIEANADIRIAEHEVIWHMTPINICRAALLTTIDE